ncbi:MAG: hypothetical protein KTR31_00460 [Myxococcales bacterium]|nr:hypothetical protein [Myxococcales bacterium]
MEVLALTLLMGGAVGCSSPRPAPADQVGDTLVMGLGFDPGNVHPLVIPYATSFALSDLVNPGLVRRIDGFELALAESASFSDDGMALTYRLRDGLVWEDGEPLTSADVAFTWDLIADPAVASNWHGTAKHVRAVEAPDERTVIYRFAAKRNPVLQQAVTVRGVVPRHAMVDLDRASLRGHPIARQPLASGPFRVASWEPDARIVLEPNPRAPAAWRPKLARLVFRVVPEYATRIVELERGGLDLVDDVQVHDVPRLAANPRIRVVRHTSDVMQYVGYNLAHPTFVDVRVRTALTLATDREQLMQRVLTVGDDVFGRPCVGTVSPAYPDWVPSDLEPRPHDPEGARTLFAEAGWSDSDEDGLLDRDGSPFGFSLMIQTGSSELEKVAVWLQAQWRQVGVSVRIEKVEPTRFSERARTKEYEALLWSFGANPVVDPSIQWRSDGPYNWMGLSDPQIDAWIDKGLHADTVHAAQQAFHEVQRRVHAAVPATFLYWRDHVIAVDARFRDTQHDTYSPIRHAERWWVPDEERRY